MRLVIAAPVKHSFYLQGLVLASRLLPFDNSTRKRNNGTGKDTEDLPVIHVTSSQSASVTGHSF